jgi:2-polyprenyl-3-methyl-5-hydroxy-6-metoxy-1,4-benzoquinol methylase
MSCVRNKPCRLDVKLLQSSEENVNLIDVQNDQLNRTRMKTRNLLPELMDDPALDPREHRRALAGLRRVNSISFTDQHITKEILRVAHNRQLKEISILDVGCGGGEVATAVACRVAERLPTQLTGWDISPTAIESASENWRKILERVEPTKQQKVRVTFETNDIFTCAEQSFDFVYCTLFLHHFTDEAALRLLRRMMACAAHGVIIDDLRRTNLGLVMATVGCHLLSRSPIVHFDGPQSVRAAFSDQEVLAMARTFPNCKVSFRRHWPQRFNLCIEIAERNTA